MKMWFVMGFSVLSLSLVLSNAVASVVHHPDYPEEKAQTKAKDQASSKEPAATEQGPRHRSNGCGAPLVSSHPPSTSPQRC